MTAPVWETKGGMSYLRRQGGDGTPFVLLHGIGSNAQSFEPLLQALDRRHTAMAWDAPGYGGSTPLTVDWPDATDYVTALMRLIDQLEMPRCILVGHSLGTLVAARFAARWPERVEAVALISPALGYQAACGGALPPPVAKRIEDLDNVGAERFAAARAGGLVGDPAARPDIVRAVQNAMAAIRRPGYDHAARMLGTGHLLGDAAKIDVPALVMVGESDRITPPANAMQVFDALPAPRERHRYRSIPGAGHAVCQENPAEVAQALMTLAHHSVAQGKPAHG